jgi:hypothetical protein
MKKREFNKIINGLVNKKTKLLDKNKMKELPIEIKDSMVKYIVRKRLPIIVDLIPESFDFEWLFCMGYLYETKGKYFSFIHTSEQKIK